MLSVVRDTFARIHWRHDHSGRALNSPANDTTQAGATLDPEARAAKLAGEIASPHALPGLFLQPRHDSAREFAEGDRLADPGCAPVFHEVTNER